MPKYVLYTGKKKEKFNRLQSEVFCVFPPEYKQPPSPPEYRPIKFILCPYIRPGRINEILRYLFSSII